jgi:hypothetical protein
MSTLDDLISNAKDDEARNLMRQVADLVAADTRKGLEEAHATALREGERQHQEALKSKDHQHATSLKVANTRAQKADDKAAALERTITARDETIATMELDHANAVEQYEREIVRQSKEIARLEGVASNATGWAWAGVGTSLALGIAALGKRRRY